ncbi:MAG: exopolysaccharide Pel transporter PelG [Granulosicoccus sp.]|nr:exopolysaccharide Pel transporter PelG [Granulosicoccus sp.]
MSGIGLEISKYLEEDSVTGTFKAYGYAGLVGAGPWVLPILGILLIGFVEVAWQGSSYLQSFTTSVSWLVGASLILTGLLQLAFTRFVTNRLFESNERLINPNLLGVMFLTTVASGLIGCVFSLFLFSQPLSNEILMIACFAVLSNVWMVGLFVSGLKRFKLMLVAFAIGYLTTMIMALSLMSFGLNGLLAGLLIGHAVLLFLLLALVMPSYPLILQPRFDFLNLRLIFPSLIAIGCLYNIGIWVDKLIFSLHPATSERVIGPMRESQIYDIPMFLAYLSVVPGIVVFFLRIETDFARAYERFFQAVKGNASLQEIEMLGCRIVESVRDGLRQIIRVQGATVLVLILLGPSLIEWLGVSSQYLPIYYICLLGVGAQVLILAVLNVLVYLDKLDDALKLTALMGITNLVFSLVSVRMGPDYYGYGFGLSMTLTAVVGIALLFKELENIEFRTFMRPRPVRANISAWESP